MRQGQQQGGYKDASPSHKTQTDTTKKIGPGITLAEIEIRQIWFLRHLVLLLEILEHRLSDFPIGHLSNRGVQDVRVEAG
jgi:hypothetical protein